ncbi:hypothetical protein I4U23_017353 [Adineta vaga]|nr:hypothetical protein I4U23_017353 [Adineta vaga]
MKRYIRYISSGNPKLSFDATFGAQFTVASTPTCSDFLTASSTVKSTDPMDQLLPNELDTLIETIRKYLRSLSSGSDIKDRVVNK